MTTTRKRAIDEASSLDAHDETRLREHLLGEAQGRFGAIPAELIVERLLTLGDGADFPVMSAALDALLRRGDFASRDGLAVAQRPARSSFGRLHHGACGRSFLQEAR